MGCILGLLAHVCPAAADPSTAGPTLTTLFQRLADTRERHLHFIETKHVRMLTQPLRIEGTLEFRPPDYLARHEGYPAEAHYIIDHDRVTVRPPGDAREINLSLADYPPLQAFAESLRAPLAGDLASVQAFWQASLGGSWKRWTLILTPRSTELTGLVRSVRLEGHDGHITRMTLDYDTGDRSELTLQPERR